MRMRPGFLVLTGAVVVLLGAGCSSGPSGATGAVGGAGGAGTGQSAAVRIGSVNTLTGGTAGAGTDVQDGEELAAEIINGAYPGLRLPFAASSGLPALGGTKVALITRDDHGSPDAAAAAVSGLVSRDKVAAIVGGYASAVTKAASARADQLRVPFVNGASTAPELTQHGLTWFFRVGPTDTVFAGQMFGLLRQEARLGRPVQRIAILRIENVYGDGAGAVTRAQAAKLGYQVVADLTYPSSVNDLAPRVRELKAANPNVLFVASYLPDSELLIRDLAAAHWHPDALLAYGGGFTDPRFLSQLGGPANGVMTRAAWSPQIPKVSAVAVARMFARQFHHPMTDSATRGFDSLMTLAVAIDNAASTDPAKIRAALVRVRIPGDQVIDPWAGIAFDASHQNKYALGLIEQVQRGRYELVYPPGHAVASVIWPLSAAAQLIPAHG